VSIQIAEEQSSGKNLGGVPGALSNQPPAATDVPEQANTEAAPGSGGSPNSRSSRKETRNFEIDKTVSHTRYAMGRLRRLSAAIVVDDKVTVNDQGERLRINRSPEEIERITELVKKAIGFSIQRGDSVNVINEAFTEPLIPEALPEQPIWEKSWVWDAAKQFMGGILLLLILFGVLRPVIKNLSKSIEPLYKVPAVAAPSVPALPDVQEDQVSLSGGEPQKKLEAPATPMDKNMLIAQQAVTEDPKLVAQVVKNWVSQE
jgi:flagellar M-ring protein FliF